MSESQPPRISCVDDHNYEQLATNMADVLLNSPTEHLPPPSLAKYPMSPCAATATSTLSVNAPEFVPRWQSASTPSRTPAQNEATPALTNNGPPVDAEVSDTEVAHYLLADINLYLSQIQNSPASFEEMAALINDLMLTYVKDDGLLQTVTDAIFYAGSEYDNFTYHCARLCAYLTQYYDGIATRSDTLRMTFRHALLKRCHQDHVLRTGMELPRLYNYALLMADLYNHVKVDGEPMKPLSMALYEIIDMLLAIPNDGNVACAVRLLKCCGAALEANERANSALLSTSAGTPKMDGIFASFEQLLNGGGNDPNTAGFGSGLSQNGKFLIRNLINTRREWSKMHATPMTSAPYEEAHDDIGGEQPPPFHRVSSETVFFGPDGNPLSAEETAFLEEEANQASSSNGEEDATYMVGGADQEDDDFDEAYEEFLKMTEAKQQQRQQQN